MKKLLSIALALMLLLASVACAEGAYVADITNIALELTQNGETQSIDLDGLDIVFRVGVADDKPVVRVDAYNGDEALLGATIQIERSSMIVKLDNMDKPFSAENTANTDASTLVDALSDPSSIQSIELPLIPGITIPKVDLMSLGSMIGAQAVDENTATFELPYESVNAILQMLMSYRSLVPEQAKPYVDQLFDAIQQMIDNNAGFALSGTITNDDESSSLTVDVFNVQDGVTSDDAMFSLVLTAAENAWSLEGLMWYGEDSITIGTITLASDPENATLALSCDFAGMLSILLSAYQENGVQVIALSFTTSEQSGEFAISYGDEGDGEFMMFTLDLPDIASLAFGSQSTGEDTASIYFNLDVQQDDPMTIELSADVTGSVQDEDLAGIEDAASAVPVDQVADELNEALSNLYVYLGSIMQPAA